MKQTLVQLLFELYGEGDIKIDVFGIANYTAAAIVEIQGLMGHMDINRVEESSAFAALRIHHDKLQERLRAMPDYLAAWRESTGVTA